jgi:membrane-associated phospholipid phosphatase
MTDITIAPPAPTVPAFRTPMAPSGTPTTFRSLRERWPLLVPFAIVLPLVLGVLAMVDRGRLLLWDQPLTSAAVDSRSPLVDDLALAVSRLGAWSVVFPLGAALAFAASRRCSRLAWIIVVTVAARPGIEWLLKDVVERPRPHGDRLVPGTGFSFPSGHVLAAVATWAFLPAVVALYTRRRELWWASVAVAGSVVGLVAWSRVWLGVHWTSDVVASLALGFLAINLAEAWLLRDVVAACDGAGTPGDELAATGDVAPTTPASAGDG